MSLVCRDSPLRRVGRTLRVNGTSKGTAPQRKRARAVDQEARILNKDEIETLSDHLGGTDGLIVFFAAFTGLRSAEIAGLQVHDLDFEGRRVHVRRALSEVRGKVEVTTTKNNKDRVVPLPPFLIERLQANLSARGPEVRPDAPVFCSARGGAHRHSNWYKRRFKPAAVELGFEDLRFHDLRHTYASLLVKSGSHPLAIKKLLGHSSIQVTMDHYGHLFPSEDETTIARLEAVFNDDEFGPPAA